MGDAARATAEYARTRDWLSHYFDRHAAETWKNLTSGGPVGWMRETVRAGRAVTERRILAWLPLSLDGVRVLDAGCGTGRLATAMALRGAQVTAVDVAATLVEQGRLRAAEAGVASRVRFAVGDMLDPALGRFDWVVAMDSLVHYEAPALLHALHALGERASAAMLVTVAPSTPFLESFHFVGRLLPRTSKAPPIVPIREDRLRAEMAADAVLGGFRVGRTGVTRSGFYTSQTLELLRDGPAPWATAGAGASLSRHPLSPEAR